MLRNKNLETLNNNLSWKINIVVTQSKPYFSCAYVLHKWKSSHVNLYFSAHSIDGRSTSYEERCFWKDTEAGNSGKLREHYCSGQMGRSRWQAACDWESAGHRCQETRESVQRCSSYKKFILSVFSSCFISQFELLWQATAPSVGPRWCKTCWRN